MLFIVVLIVSLILLAIFGDTSKNKTASSEPHSPVHRSHIPWPIMIIGSIIFFPIAVILALTKNYK